MSFISEHNEKYKDFKPIQNTAVTAGWCKYPYVTIYHGVIIGDNVSIGRGTILYPGVVICDNTTIGKNCIIGSNSVIGMEGFSSRIEDGKAFMMRNVGTIKIGDNVDIGANVCIDRASLENWSTTIGNNVKIDNLCHISHNMNIGNDTRIAPMCAFGGGTIIGNRVWIGIGVVTKEHTIIGDDSFVNMGSVVIADVPSCSKIGGHYATDYRNWNKFSKLVNNGEI